jgi:hypothetical protein
MELNGIQRALEGLRAKGRSYPAIADVIGVNRATVYRWRQGIRPDSERAVVGALRQLLRRRGPPRRPGGRG